MCNQLELAVRSSEIVKALESPERLALFYAKPQILLPIQNDGLNFILSLYEPKFGKFITENYSANSCHWSWLVCL